MLLGAGALLTAIAGLCGLYWAWRRWEPAPYRTLAGWLLLAAAGVLWAQAAGWEFGLALALFVPSVLAWLFVIGNREQRRRRRRSAPAVPPAGRRGSVARHLALFLVTVPLAAAAAVLVTVALSRLLPVPVVDVMALVVIAIPPIWGLAAYWACADRRLWRPAVALAAVALAGGAVVYG